MRTTELIGRPLDYAVAKAQGLMLVKDPFGSTAGMKPSWFIKKPVGYQRIGGKGYSPSTNWSQGGPIIEREKIGLVYYPDINCMTQEVLPKWIGSNVLHSATDPTPLIAAMRCYVASKFGDEVEIPEELK